jgi:hypothetical protein
MSLGLTALVVAASVAVAVGGFLLLRRHAPPGGFFSDGDRAAGILGLISTAYAILLGFVVFLAFTSYDTARSGARSEATDLIQQFETAQLMPKAAAPALSGELVCYGRAVVGIEWPLLRRGVTTSFNPWGLALFETLRTVEPRTASEQAAYSRWLDQTAAREEARLDRIKAGSGVIPAPLWIITLLLGVLVVAYVALFADPAERVLPQALTASVVAATLATSVMLIRFLDNPYARGSGSLQPTDMVRVLGQIDQASHALGLRVHAPCTKSGAATGPRG